jgi:hypothetical protein
MMVPNLNMSDALRERRPVYAPNYPWVLIDGTLDRVRLSMGKVIRVGRDPQSARRSLRNNFAT